MSGVQESSARSTIAHVVVHAATSSSAERGWSRMSSQPASAAWGKGVVSAPGTPMTVHSQKTRVPAAWPAIAQIGQPTLEVESPEGARRASSSGDMV
jgi:hypothetical protein